MSKTYPGTTRPAVHDVSFDIAPGEFIVLLGPSGCGKTTLLKMTNRLIDTSSGTIEVNGRDINSVRVTSLRRGMGYVIQQVGLFPHINVAGNIGIIPNLLGWTRRRTAARTEELLELVGLDPQHFRKRYPAQLSGGQQQRVGLARALAADPAILLMDEPFGAIDAITRARLQDELVAIQRRVKKTVVFVTHDVDEALRLADRLVVMNEGALVQYDVPLNVLTKPANGFVRSLLNTDDILRQFGILPVKALMQLIGINIPAIEISSRETVRDALSRMFAAGVDELAVLDDERRPVGLITFDRIRQFGSRAADAENVEIGA